MPETPWCHFPWTNLLKGTLSHGLSPEERSRQQQQETPNALLLNCETPHSIQLKRPKLQRFAVKATKSHSRWLTGTFLHSLSREGFLVGTRILLLVVGSLFDEMRAFRHHLGPSGLSGHGPLIFSILKGVSKHILNPI